VINSRGLPLALGNWGPWPGGWQMKTAITNSPIHASPGPSKQLGGCFIFTFGYGQQEGTWSPQFLTPRKRPGPSGGSSGKHSQNPCLWVFGPKGGKNPYAFELPNNPIQGSARQPLKDTVNYRFPIWLDLASRAGLKAVEQTDVSSLFGFPALMGLGVYVII